MANRRNAVKKIRQDAKKRLENRVVIAEIRTMRRTFVGLCTGRELEKARAYAPGLFSKLDKAVKKGILKENTANRTKSRISRRLHLVQG